MAINCDEIDLFSHLWSCEYEESGGLRRPARLDLFWVCYFLKLKMLTRLTVCG